MHHDLFPITDPAPHFCGLLKVLKATMPLQPIVSSIGTILYDVAKYLAKVLSPLVGKTEHHTMNSKDFIKDDRKIRIEPDEELHSYNMSALFPCVPVDKAIQMIREKLEEDQAPGARTPLAPDDIIRLLSLCLKCTCTYFLFQGAYYFQIHGADIGSPVSLTACNLYMEYFEQ